MTHKSEPVFHGAAPCAREGCLNHAYWAVGAQLLCGVHSKKDAERRRELPKDPDAKRKRGNAKDAHAAHALKAVLDAHPWLPIVEYATTAPWQPGHLACYRMRMMRQVPLEGMWVNVFPNNKASATRDDGWSYPALSPMRLGPVKHGQPGLPEAMNIENLHQFSKVWPSELVSIIPGNVDVATVDLDTLPAPSAVWTARRDAGYRDPEPHRHKFGKAQQDLEEVAVGGPNKNSPVYAVYLTKDGKPRRFTYVESRYFYCCAYEALATQQADYLLLLEWHRRGVDLRLCGYDAFDMGEDADADTLYMHYTDPEKPFGHERVLYALLALADQPASVLPWHRYRREHAERYVNIAHVQTDYY